MCLKIPPLRRCRSAGCPHVFVLIPRESQTHTLLHKQTRTPKQEQQQKQTQKPQRKHQQHRQPTEKHLQNICKSNSNHNRNNKQRCKMDSSPGLRNPGLGNVARWIRVLGYVTQESAVSGMSQHDSSVLCNYVLDSNRTSEGPIQPSSGLRNPGLGSFCALQDEFESGSDPHKPQEGVCSSKLQHTTAAGNYAANHSSRQRCHN